MLMFQDVVCNGCGAFFTPTPSQTKYCSRACYLETRASNRRMATCQKCGKEFRNLTGKSRYCSRACYSQARHDDNPRTNCEVCGKEIVVERENNKYCSRECYYKSQIGHAPTNPLKRVLLECPVCHKEFEAGGRSGKKATTKHCSQRCMAIGVAKHPESGQLDPMDAAYLAGFFDGEGSVIHLSVHSWRICIYQCDEAVIQWIAEVTGTGRITFRSGEKAGGNLVKQSKFKDAWVWSSTGVSAASVLLQLLPYLKVKKAKAQEMILDFCRPGNEEWQKQWQDRLRGVLNDP